MDHYDHSKIKNSEILAFSNFIFTEFNSHANKNPSYTSFYTFSTSTQKVHLTKVKTNLTSLQTLRDKAC